MTLPSIKPDLTASTTISRERHLKTVSSGRKPELIPNDNKQALYSVLIRIQCSWKSLGFNCSRYDNFNVFCKFCLHFCNSTTSTSCTFDWHVCNAHNFSRRTAASHRRHSYICLDDVLETFKFRRSEKKRRALNWETSSPMLSIKWNLGVITLISFRVLKDIFPHSTELSTVFSQDSIPGCLDGKPLTALYLLWQKCPGTVCKNIFVTKKFFWKTL